jgi:hypothetical protein
MLGNLWYANTRVNMVSRIGILSKKTLWGSDNEHGVLHLENVMAPEKADK